MRREEEERRERYVAGVRRRSTISERDIALASYDGEAAAGAIVALADALHGANAAGDGGVPEFGSARRFTNMGGTAAATCILIAAIALRRRLLALASPGDARGAGPIGVALGMLGEREGGAARLEEAVAAFRAGLGNARERVPLAWATMQAMRSRGSERGRAGRLGSRGGAIARRWRKRRAAASARLGDDAEQSRRGARDARRARARNLAPRAGGSGLSRRSRGMDARAGSSSMGRTQNNLGNALRTLGERESGTARLEEAVAAYRAALEECTRERVPLDWAMTQIQSRQRALDARRARERDGAARGSGSGLSRGARRN